MVDNATAVAQQPKFTEIRYKTKDGENCSATKKDGIVTIQGDKNGVRQMTLEQFVQEEMQKIVPPDLEKTPKKDTVSFSGGEKSEDSSEEEKKSSHTGLYATLAGMALVTTAAILAHKRSEEHTSELQAPDQRVCRPPL